MFYTSTFLKVLFFSVICFLSACSDSEFINNNPQLKYQAFPQLPTNTSEVIEITGAIQWWFWEGDGGCFGTISDGHKHIELHALADLCEPIEYDEGQTAVIKITYDPNEKFRGKVYSILHFSL
jgi:hypothetical protein